MTKHYLLKSLKIDREMRLMHLRLLTFSPQTC